MKLSSAGFLLVYFGGQLFGGRVLVVSPVSRLLFGLADYTCVREH